MNSKIDKTYAQGKAIRDNIRDKHFKRAVQKVVNRPKENGLYEVLKGKNVEDRIKFMRGK